MTNQPNQTTFNIDEFSKQSETYYNEIKSDLEAKHAGKYVAINFEVKQFWIGDTASEALTEAKKAFPEKLFYLVQVGAPATFSIQSMVKGKGLLRKAYGS